MIYMQLFRVDTDQFIRQRAIEAYILQNENKQVDTAAFEYYEFEGNSIFYYE